MDELVAIGVVPDEVLLLCGKPSSAPSTWWTPSLVGREEDEVEALVGAARDLVAADLREGPLADVAAVVADARLLVLLRTTDLTGGVTRRSIVVGPDRALFDLQDADAGLHDLLLAAPAPAAMLLADVVAGPAGRTPSVDVVDLAGTRTADEVAAVLPEGERIETTTLVRVAADAPEGTGHLATLVHHPSGSVACWSRPDGRVEVQVVADEDAAAEVALGLLGADTAEVAA